MVRKKILAVGVVTYNNEIAELNRYVQSFQTACRVYEEQSPHSIEFRLVYIDNGKRSKVKAIHQDAVKLPSLGNVGYSSAMAAIMESVIAMGDVDYFVCSNPDGAFDPFFFSNILSFAKKYPGDLIEALQFPEEHPKVYDPVTFKTAWASGCCTLFPIDLLKEVGVLDRNFFMYVEDVDFSWRVRAAGRSIRTCPKALYAHFVINRKPNPIVNKYFYESGRYLALKWKNKKFQNHCEKSLIELGFYKTTKKMPRYGNLKSTAGVAQKKKIQDFEHFFHFSKVRWV